MLLTNIMGRDGSHCDTHATKNLHWAARLEVTIGSKWGRSIREGMIKKSS